MRYRHYYRASGPFWTKQPLSLSHNLWRNVLRWLGLSKV